MSRKSYSFPFGETCMEVSLPSEQVLYDVKGNSAEEITDIPAAVRHALRNPIGAPPLSQVVAPGNDVVITVGDITRAWIKHDQFLPVLLDELNALWARIAPTPLRKILKCAVKKPATVSKSINMIPVIRKTWSKSVKPRAASL